MKDSIISSIDNHVLQNEEQIQRIIQDRNKDKDMILNAQDIVRKFIIDRKLIIFGGLAIDYALRLKGSSIYYDGELPDYDCISNRNVDDAYDLGEILNAKGFENVRVIRAKHVETMRVRVNLITVADIGYIPTKYFKQYKYIVYNQLHILHPDIQRLDLHKAFCFPLNNAPMEDIFHRWNKDLHRFNLYEKYYPIKEIQCNYNCIEYKYELPAGNFAYHGFAAFALYRKELLKHVDINFPKLDIEITKTHCKFSSPVKGLCIVTSEVKCNTNPILGYIPKSLHNNDLHIYQVNMLSITRINNVQVVNIQYLLMWFLFHYNFDDNSLYGNFYLYTLQMIELSSIIKKNNPFNPTLEFMGDAIYEPMVQNPNYPVNYTPSRTGTRQVFDYNNFPMSGELI